MLIFISKIYDLKVVDRQTNIEIGKISKPIIKPSDLSIQAFYVDLYRNPKVDAILNIVDIIALKSDMVIVSSISDIHHSNEKENDEINKISSLNFDLLKLRVITTRRKVIGTIADYSIDINEFKIIQLLVKPGVIKRISEARRLVNRSQIKQINRDHIVIDDKESILKGETTTTESSTYTNPFRKQPVPEVTN